MKTSNKLLVALGVGIFLLVGLLQLVLYSNYRQGLVISAKELHTENYNRYKLAAPSYLWLSWALWGHIIPSDTFYVQLPKENKLTGALSYRQSGDTLLSTGKNEVPIHRPSVA